MTPSLKRKAISSVMATLLLIVIAVTSGAIVYTWITGYVGQSAASPAHQGAARLTIDAVSSRSQTILGASPYIIIYVRNTGSSPATIKTVYIYDATYSLKAVGTVADGNREQKVTPGSVAEIPAAVDSQLSPGSYFIKVTSSEGASTAQSHIFHVIVMKGVVMNVTPSNDVNNKVVYEDDYAKYKWWVSLEPSGNYKLWFRVYAKPGVTIQKVYGELFASDGEHPDWVGSNPWTWTTPYSYPDWAGAEWTPIKPSEFPVYVIFAIEV